MKVHPKLYIITHLHAISLSCIWIAGLQVTSQNLKWLYLNQI